MTLGGRRSHERAHDHQAGAVVCPGHAGGVVVPGHVVDRVTLWAVKRHAARSTRNAKRQTPNARK